MASRACSSSHIDGSEIRIALKMGLWLKLCRDMGSSEAAIGVQALWSCPHLDNGSSSRDSICIA